MNASRAWHIGGVVLVGVLLVALGRMTAPVPTPAATDATDAAVTSWTCSMHPEIHLPHPGKCPKCGMDLIPETRKQDTSPRELALTETAKQLAQIATVKVERRRAEVTLRLTGKIGFDETQVKTIAAYLPGRLTRLYVDYTGLPVKAGEHMVDIYSPDLYSAQEEFLLAQKAARAATGTMRNDALLTAQAAREKLALLGLGNDQLDEIIKVGKPSSVFTLRSPIGGIVITKNATEGAYVDRGTPLYTVANLSQVWVRLDAYEQDLAWLRYRQQVSFTTEAYGGETFHGWISFIDPVLNPETRTVSVRVLADNADGQLKPNMFVRATVAVPMDGAGQPIAPSLAGKWVCPMHGQMVKDAPGTCDICGMPLVAGKDAPSSSADAMPLMIPVTAPLLTGTRAIVYVAVPSDGMPRYENREVELGPRAGDWYPVRAGLKEGESIVVQGAFKLDASLQIAGKSSMMAPGTETAAPTPTKETPSTHPAATAPTAEKAELPAALRTQLDGVVQASLAIGTALYADDDKAAATAALAFRTALAGVDMKLFPPQLHMLWMKDADVIGKQTDTIAATHDIKEQRKAFASLNTSLIDACRRFAPLGAGALYVMHCPMALDSEGADWLSATEAVDNPYFGPAMPHCGEITATLRKGD